MDGILIVNKPKNFTSHDVVSIIRKKFDTKKVGHAGTLDPNATGVLPILIGKATKLSKYFLEHDKEYIATIKLGEKTDTGDLEGKVIDRDKNIKKILENLDKEKISNILIAFLGKQKQTPPMYSAIKINGKKAYEYAREGKSIKLEPRDIEIYKIEFLSFSLDELKIKVLCSKGTYIRSLCEDISEKLGTIGFTKELERTKINEFEIENGVTIDEIESNPEKAKNKIISIENLFQDKEKINLDERKKELFLNGVRLTFIKPNDIYNIYSNNIFIGIGIIENNLLKRDVVL